MGSRDPPEEAADLPLKKEVFGGREDAIARVASFASTPWFRMKDPRVVRVSRAFGGKDRHSKVCTIRGLRDRRVRLSVPTAIQLYDLQDRLGLSQPSKVVDWLLDAAKQEIDELPPLPVGAVHLGQPHMFPQYSSSAANVPPYSLREADRSVPMTSSNIDLLGLAGSCRNKSTGDESEDEGDWGSVSRSDRVNHREEKQEGRNVAEEGEFVVPSNYFPYGSNVYYHPDQAHDQGLIIGTASQSSSEDHRSLSAAPMLSLSQTHSYFPFGDVNGFRSILMAGSSGSQNLLSISHEPGILDYSLGHHPPSSSSRPPYISFDVNTRVSGGSGDEMDRE